MPSKDSRGGPIYCEPPFVAALRAAGIEVDEETYVYGSDVPFIRRVLRVVEAARRLRRRLLGARYDVVHLNTSFDEKCVLRDLFTLALLRSSGVPVHLKMHGSAAAFLKTKKTFWRYLQKRIFAMAADIGVLSSEELEMFLAAGCPLQKLSHAVYSVAGEAFTKDAHFAAHHNIRTNTPILLFSARFIPAKGLLDVIDACGELKRSGRDFFLFCLGDGLQRAEAEEKVAELQLSEQVLFTGYITETETTAFHSNCDIFVFPTFHDEGFPLVLLKSLAAGSPVVTTRIRAAADIFTEPENCLWVEPRSPHQLAEKISQLIDDPASRKAMSENNRRLAEKFTPLAVAEQYIRLYRSLSPM